MKRKNKIIKEYMAGTENMETVWERERKGEVKLTLQTGFCSYYRNLRVGAKTNLSEFLIFNFYFKKIK